MEDQATTVLDLRERVRAFVRERDWEQFHNPKDLAAAIAIEAAELMEPFLWQGPDEAERTAMEAPDRQRVVDELADVLILCLSMANRLDLDLATAIASKLEANAARYPAHLARGSARKYTHYQNAEPEKG